MGPLGCKLGTRTAAPLRSLFVCGGVWCGGGNMSVANLPLLQVVEYQNALEQRDHIIGQMEAGIKQLMHQNLEAEAKGRKAEEHYSGEVRNADTEHTCIFVS